MKKRTLALNLILLLVMAMLTLKISSDWVARHSALGPAAVLAEVNPTPPTAPPEPIDTRARSVDDGDVAYIGENNLFHRDRNMNLPQTPQAEDAPPPPPPPPRLTNPPTILGFVEIDGQRAAHIRDSQREQGGDPRFLVAGDVWDELWSVAEIREDSMLMSAGETTELIKLGGGGAPRGAPGGTPGRTRTATVAPGGGRAGATPVLTIGGAQASATASAQASAAPSAPPPTPAGRPDRMAGADATRGRVAGSSPGAAAQDRSRTSGRQLFESRMNRNPQQQQRGVTTPSNTRRNPFLPTRRDQ